MKLKNIALLTLATITLAGCSANDVLNQSIENNKGAKVSAVDENLNAAQHGNKEEKTNTEIAKEVANDVAEKTKEVATSEQTKKVANDVVDKTKEIANSETTKTVVDEAKKGFGKVFSKAKEETNKFLGTDTPTSNATQGELANLDFEKGSNPVVAVNGNKSNLNPSDWTSNHIEYSNLDSLNRVGTATAYLDKNNLGKSEGRASQKWQPTGWKNQKVSMNGKKSVPYNRGHLIAYTVTFNLDDNGNVANGHKGSIDNPKNLFTQTDYSNKVLFQRYEEQVRDSIANGHRVIYQVSPVFRGNELVARGAQLQAISDDGSLNFNVFIHNVQPGASIDYATGRVTSDNSMTVAK